MFTINSMQILYKEAGFMQSIVAHQTKVKLVINNDRTYESKQVPLKQRLSTWNSTAFPMIEVPRGPNSYNLEFFFYKNSQEVGKAKCIAIVGKNKKDCLDVANKNFTIIAKFVYQIVWRSGQPQQIYNYSPQLLIAQTFDAVVTQKQQNQHNPIYPSLNSQYIQPDQYQYNQYAKGSVSQSQYRPPNLRDPYFKNSYSQSTVNESQKRKPAKKEKGMLQGMFGGCFGCGMKKRANKRPFFAIQPIVLQSVQLPYAPQGNNQSFSIQYYSKRLAQKYRT